VLGQVAVELGIAGVAVVPPAGRQEEIHDVQAVAQVVGPGLLVNQTAAGQAADIALFRDVGAKRVGLDLDERALVLDDDLRRPGRQQQPDGKVHDGASTAGLRRPW
jgi:hypothetical protein